MSSVSCLASGAHDEKWAPDGILKGKINHGGEKSLKKVLGCL